MNHYVADAQWEEEHVASSRLSVAVNSQGQLCGMQLTGAGGVSAAKLMDLLEVARTTGRLLLRRLDRLLDARAVEAADEEDVEGMDA